VDDIVVKSAFMNAAFIRQETGERFAIKAIGPSAICPYPNNPIFTNRHRHNLLGIDHRLNLVEPRSRDFIPWDRDMGKCFAVIPRQPISGPEPKVALFVFHD